MVKDWCRKAAKEQGSQLASPGSTGMKVPAQLRVSPSLHTGLHDGKGKAQRQHG